MQWSVNNVLKCYICLFEPWPLWREPTSVFSPTCVLFCRNPKLVAKWLAPSLLIARFPCPSFYRESDFTIWSQTCQVPLEDSNYVQCAHRQMCSGLLHMQFHMQAAGGAAELLWPMVVGPHSSGAIHLPWRQRPPVVGLELEPRTPLWFLQRWRSTKS